MAKYPYLTRSGPRGILWFRRTVPARLRPFVGRREILESLSTNVLEEGLVAYHYFAAMAESELRQAQADFEEQGDDDESGTIINHLMLDPDEQCRWHYEQCREAERQLRVETTARVSADPAAFWRGEIISLPLSQEAFYHQPAFSRMRESGEGYKFALAMAYRHRLKERSEVLKAMLATQDFPALARVVGSCVSCAEGMGVAFARTELKLIDDLLADDAALMAPAASAAALAPVPAQVANPVPATAPKLSAVVAEWVDSCSRGTASWSEERTNLCRRVLEDFIHACGDKPIDSYGRSDGRNFLGLLRRLPANLDKVQARLGVASRDLERLAAAAEQHGLPPQDDATVNKKLGIIKQCFKWIMTHYDECLRSPVDGMQVKVQRNARDQKEPFTAEQLNQLFRAPLYTGCQSELHWKIPGDTVLRASPKFWVPLIGLYTGMRLGEICQLSRSHVRVHEAIHYFALSKDLRLKNDASIRSVPIHRDLIAFGLLEFVAMCDDRLFPDLPQHSSGRLSDGFGKHFARFLKSLGIKTDRVDFHSLRHNFIAAADASGVEFSARERLVGHVLQGQAARYGRPYEHEGQDLQLLATRDREIQKLRFPDLSLEHLR